ncbi:MAG: hypothetical protein HYR63_12020 [Proteobacteria bacterium]|nr:hypothetical protein [Pseudomonadota bacterium]MBI3498511.1 hypothetical protein [Pseudomonadota bacterium]
MIPIGFALTNELAKNNTWPIRLFAIATDGPAPLFVTDSDKEVLHQGVHYDPMGISYSQGTKKKSLELDTYSVVVDNINGDMLAWALTTRPIGRTVTAYKGLTAGATVLDAGSDCLTLIGVEAVTLFSGRITALKADVEMEFSVKSNLYLAGQRGPISMQDVSCRFRGLNGFKGPNCGYTGSETACNFTFARCQQLGNQLRFGGFPDLTEGDYR